MAEATETGKRGNVFLFIASNIEPGGIVLKSTSLGQFDDPAMIETIATIYITDHPKKRLTFIGTNTF